MSTRPPISPNDPVPLTAWIALALVLAIFVFMVLPMIFR